MPAGVCWAASRLQLQSVILNPEDKDDVSAHWISMLRDTDQTTPSEGAHIPYRLCIHLEGAASDTVSLGRPTHSGPIHEHESCAKSIVWAQRAAQRICNVRLCMLAVSSARSSC